jgi:hypothetical protein
MRRFAPRTDEHGLGFITNVIPANAGIQAIAAGVDSRLRGNDIKAIRVHP